uniref:Fungal lipase-type domain-containing protein n=1 Tax=Amphora coffeiformis TaxID=265554 RepID=A0A7S3PC07_9STRA
MSSTPVPVEERFRLKTDGAVDDENVSKRQGRVYSYALSQQPGGIRVEEALFGMKMAHLSCTDDSDERLKGSGANTKEALKEIVGSDDLDKPLSELLSKHFDLKLDCWMDESGFRWGRPVDTQGFIASNEDMIVLSYRFSTTTLDWMTNLSTASSEWEPAVDELIGHAGLCSCYDGLFTKWFTSRGKPRVHTGFYNNFLYTLPMIRQHILQPLLASNAKPRKVYICGCSLGAAISTMAFCFLLEELYPTLANPDAVHHKLIHVTAGSPRVCDPKMCGQVMDKVQALRALDRAVICRMVYNQDLVPHIPFHVVSGFTHLDTLVYITPDGDVLINPALPKSRNFAEIKQVLASFRNKEPKEKEKQPTKSKGDNKSSDEATQHSAVDDVEKEKTPFEIEVEKTPGPIRDHMPFWYLTCLQKLKAKQDAGEVQ